MGLRFKRNLEQLRQSTDFRIADAEIEHHGSTFWNLFNHGALFQRFSSDSSVNSGGGFVFLYDTRFVQIFQQIYSSTDREVLRLFASAAQFAFKAMANSTGLSLTDPPQITAIARDESNYAMVS